jgi:AhpD family alkylhydroperoxidase
MIAHFEATLTTGTPPTKLKELVIVRTSQLNGCEYCIGSHTQIAMKLGLVEGTTRRSRQLPDPR